MSLRSGLVGALLVACATVGSAQIAEAQGLGDVAAREKQKRRQPRRVITEDDLRGDAPRPGSPQQASTPAAEAAAPSGTGAPSGPQPAAASASAPNADGAGPVDEERQRRILLEAEWRTRFANARQRLAVADAESWRDAYRTDLINGVAVRVRTREQVATPELTSARQFLADLEEELRRTGLPAGWAAEPY